MLEEPNGETVVVKRKVEDTSKRWRTVKGKLMDKRNREESNLRQLVKYVSLTDELDNWVRVTSSNVATATTSVGQDRDDADAVSKHLDQLKVMSCANFIS